MHNSKARALAFHETLVTKDLTVKEIVIYTTTWVRYELTWRSIGRSQRRLRKYAKRLNQDTAVFHLRQELDSL